ncbi:hypothetical protein DVK02_07335 [Halobellus sp. Atlit-31R]|nr:hypothetical protein DVK02_07335 [Halobellus sp. Atlit-31R]
MRWSSEELRMSRALDSDSESPSQVYHVVCHDCREEHVSGTESEAEALLSEHRSATDHDVEVAALRAPETT